MSSDASHPKNAYAGAKVVVMGLGLNGGGLESARFLASRGADVTVTDLRDERTLEPSLAELAGLPIRYVLGKHEAEDFASADFVVKNPAVKPDSPFLAAARRIETDLSIFLAHCPGPIVAVTGSKGKSSTASALHWALAKIAAAGRQIGPERRSFLGGNITVSPLTFLDSLRADDYIVLELSSWQLGDLAGRVRQDGRKDADGRPEALLKPRVAVITAIMADHLDRYGTMDAYVADKRSIYAGQDRADATVTGDDEWGRSFASETRGRVLVYASEGRLPDGAAGGWLEGPGGEGPGMARDAEGRIAEVVPASILTPGRHQKRNLLAAALALIDLGFEPEAVRDGLGSFPGIEHRLEFFLESKGVRFYNDSAATIPEAAAAAIDAFATPPVLVAGGNDKALDFRPLVEAAPRAKAIFLLAGTGTAKLAPMLEAAGVPYGGPFDRLDAAVTAAVSAAGAGDPVVLSPGCTSFGMFLNEFDRGRKWKDAVERIAR